MSDWKERITQIIDQAKALKAGYAQTWAENIRRYGKICIFGAGEHGIAWYHILRSWNIAVDYFCDNNERKWEKEVIDGIVCYSPRIISEEKTPPAIVIAVRDYEPIFNQMSQFVCGGGGRKSLYRKY